MCGNVLRTVRKAGNEGFWVEADRVGTAVANAQCVGKRRLNHTGIGKHYPIPRRPVLSVLSGRASGSKGGIGELGDCPGYEQWACGLSFQIPNRLSRRKWGAARGL